MPARKPVRRRRSPAPPVTAAGDALNTLTLLVGQLGGKLETHIEAVMQDRAERENDRHDSAHYRSEVRKTLNALDAKLGALDTHAGRIKALEDSAADYKTFRNRIYGGVLVIGFFWSLLAVNIKEILKKVF